jgi:hypothetical protein
MTTSSRSSIAQSLSEWLRVRRPRCDNRQGEQFLSSPPLWQDWHRDRDYIRPSFVDFKQLCPGVPQNTLRDAKCARFPSHKNTTADNA